MQINITGRHFEISDAIRTYATEKAEKLQKFYNGITGADILLKGEDRTFHCELILHMDSKNTAVVDVKHDSMYAAIDLATDKAQRQVRKHKEKQKDHHPEEATQKFATDTQPEAPTGGEPGQATEA